MRSSAVAHSGMPTGALVPRCVSPLTGVRAGKKFVCLSSGGLLVWLTRLEDGLVGSRKHASAMTAASDALRRVRPLPIADKRFDPFSQSGWPAPEERRPVLYASLAVVFRSHVEAQPSRRCARTRSRAPSPTTCLKVRFANPHTLKSRPRRNFPPGLAAALLPPAHAHRLRRPAVGQGQERVRQHEGGPRQRRLCMRSRSGWGCQSALHVDSFVPLRCVRDGFYELDRSSF
jgi:hypothetical protein